MAADLNLKEIHDFLISVAQKAGEMITSAHPTTEAAGSKKNCTAFRALIHFSKA
jgi:myo-inositol-1(or 4)-monophosphatase